MEEFDVNVVRYIRTRVRKRVRFIYEYNEYNEDYTV